jgi:hypothetical protein
MKTTSLKVFKGCHRPLGKSGLKNKHIVKHGGTVGDLSIKHPLNVSGTHQDGTTKVGRWWDTNRHP